MLQQAAEYPNCSRQLTEGYCNWNRNKRQIIVRKAIALKAIETKQASVRGWLNFVILLLLQMIIRYVKLSIIVDLVIW